MNLTVEISILGGQGMAEQLAKRLREVFEVVEERDEFGDGDLVRKTLAVNAHTGRVNRIELVIDTKKEG